MQLPATHDHHAMLLVSTNKVSRMNIPGVSNNPFLKMGNGVINTVGSVAQGAQTLGTNASTQASIAGGGNTEALNATKEENALNDKNNAALARMQGAAARETATQNTLNAIQSANNDAASKFISSTAQSAKAISY
ncbi:HrpA pilus formation protein [Pseudomonas sp. NFR16]|nr:HrpA pilus formation protein [Pseudomonas sp. NFR16]